MIRRLSSLLLLSAALLPAVRAERADRDKPTLLEGAQCVTEELKQISVCSGNVVLVRGTLRITGERLEVREDPEGYRQATVTAAPGRLATFRQRQDATRPGVEEFVEGAAERIEYDERAETVKLIQRAQWKRLENEQPRDEVSGNLITYDSRSSTYNVDGGRAEGGDGRVRLILSPRSGDGVAPPPPAPHADRSRLDVSHLQKRYGTRLVVKDVSLAVEAGEVVGLLGPNGAGKTTCFYMVVGLVPLDGGTIALDGRSIAHLPIHRRARMGLSYLPQEASVFRRLTVEENIRAVLELQVDGQRRPLAAAEVTRRLDQLLDDLQIAALRTSPALALSGGERRRVEIARALASSPRFILLDEPFAGVDPIAVIEIQRIVRFLKERGIGVLITDHNVRETLGICDHAYIINDGEVLAAGRPEEIVENESVRRVYLGEHFRM